MSNAIAHHNELQKLRQNGQERISKLIFFRSQSKAFPFEIAIDKEPTPRARITVYVMSWVIKLLQSQRDFFREIVRMTHLRFDKIL